MVELTSHQAALLLFFAQDGPVDRVHVRTCRALTAKGLIRCDRDSGVYTITEFGHAVAAALRRSER